VPSQQSNAAQAKEGVPDYDNTARRFVHPHGGFNYISYRWVVSDSGLQMLPVSKTRGFNWSYLLSHRLRRMNPGKFF